MLNFQIDNFFDIITEIFVYLLNEIYENPNNQISQNYLEKFQEIIGYSIIQKLNVYY